VPNTFAPPSLDCRSDFGAQSSLWSGMRWVKGASVGLRRAGDAMPKFSLGIS